MSIDLDADIGELSQNLLDKEEEKPEDDQGKSNVEKELNNLLQRTYMAGYNEAEMKSNEERTELYVLIANVVTTIAVLGMMYHQFYM